MAPNKSFDALARRDELRGQLDPVEHALDEASTRLERIRAEQGDDRAPRGTRGGQPRPLRSSRALAQARVDAARGLVDAQEVADRERELAEVEAQIAEATDATKVARRAQQEIERDLANLYVDSFDQFARAAEAKADAVRAAWEEVAPALRDFVTAWEEVASAWRPALRANGHMAPVPPCPLPSPEEVAGVAPRPPSVEQPPGTQYVTYRHEDGREMVTGADSPFRAGVEGQRGWRAVSTRRGVRGVETPIEPPVPEDEPAAA